VPRSYLREARRRVGPKRARILPIVERLRAEHPDATIALQFGSPLELLVSVMLSAQTTDVNVNRVTERLFVRYRRPEDYLAVPQEELERDIFATGFFRQKAKAIRGTMRMLLDDFGGEVPRTVEELVRLPGVARKTANVVAAELGEAQGVVVDTHVRRLSQRLALTRQEDPVKIERDLMRLVPREHWAVFPHLLIWHGRRVCDARRPDCERCAVNDLCPSSRVDVVPFLARQVPYARNGEHDQGRDDAPEGGEGERGREAERLGGGAGQREADRLEPDAQHPVDRRNP
jgi:endonuclease-3